MKVNWKVVGAVAAVGGALLSLIGGAAESKKTEALIKDEAAKAVTKALAERGSL